MQGKDSRLYQALVQQNGLTGEVTGGINSGLGDMYNINGPTLWDVSLFYDKDKTSDQILKVFDVEIEKVKTTPVDQATLDRALVKVRSQLYDKMEQFGGFGKADLLASFALFDDDPSRINKIEEEFREGDARAHAEDREGIPARRKSHDPRDRSEGTPRPTARAGRRRQAMKKTHTKISSPRPRPRPASSAAPALRAQKQTPPAPGTPKGFSLPKPATFTLENGLGVTLVQYGTVPKATVNLGVRTGNVDEKANEVWLADLMGEMLSEGTTTRSRIEDRRGRRPHGRFARHRRRREPHRHRRRRPLRVRARDGRSRGRRGAEPQVPGGRALAPQGRQGPRALDREDQPQPLAQEKFRAVLYGDHPYGRLFPTEAMLSGYTIAQVKGFYDRNFGAARSHVYVVGRFDARRGGSRDPQGLRGLEEGAAPNTTKPSPKSERAVYLIDRPGAPQSTINIGMPVIDPSNPDWDRLYS